MMRNQIKERRTAAPAPIYSPEAEQSVIGGLMLDNSAWDKIDEQVSEDDFYDSKHRLIFRAIGDLGEQKQPFDIITIGEKLKQLNELDNAGGEAYLFELAKNTPSVANILFYANVVKEKSQLRRLNFIADDIKQDISEGTEPNAIIATKREALKQLEINSLQSIPMPISLDKINLSCIDKGLLPGWLGEMAYGVSEATETPLELPAMMALAVLSTCCQSKFIVEVEEGYCEPVNIWTIAALESANRKSSVVKILTSPLVEWEQEQAEIIKPEINRAASRKKTVESTIIRLRKKAATASGDNFSKLQNDIEELEQSIPEIPKIPRLWAQDITPENLGITMAKHGDKLAIISPEGGIVEMMAGRYSGGIPNIDIYLHGHAGDSLRVDRNNRPPVFMNHPALTLGLAPQPDVLRSLAARKEFDTRGLLARFLYVLPKSNLGERKLISKPIPENVKQKYTASLKKLLAIDNDNIFKLKLSFEANRRWKDYAKAVETQLKDGGKFEHIKSWAGKLPGAVIRIAGLFHCVNFADYADVFGGNTKSLLIGDISIIKAIDLAKILSEQALAAFDLMQADQNLNGARKVLNWIKTKNISDFSVKECFDSLRTFKRVKHLMPALEILEEHNYIFKQENETLFAGRPSNIFRVNPHLGADEK